MKTHAHPEVCSNVYNSIIHNNQKLLGETKQIVVYPVQGILLTIITDNIVYCTEQHGWISKTLC